jgi:hypothetical protein
MTKYLVFDISNLLYRTFFAHHTEDDITIAGLATHSALLVLNKYYREHKPHKIVMAFDNSSWRKDYTASDECISKKPYKGNRRQGMTPREKIKYDQFCQHLNEFQVIIRDHTSVITLSNDGLEADDLVAGFVQLKSLEPDSHITIISGDMDFIQLLGTPNVRLIDPASGKDRTLAEWNGDPEYFLFEKCLRGDRGDNVQSACPRVRSTTIEKAYTNEFEKANLMNQSWKGTDGTEYIVKKLFKENQLLMDLRCQPEEIQMRIMTTILAALKNPGTFSYFHFMKFLGKYQLKKVAEQADQFVGMLSK